MPLTKAMRPSSGRASDSGEGRSFLDRRLVGGRGLQRAQHAGIVAISVIASAVRLRMGLPQVIHRSKMLLWRGNAARRGCNPSRNSATASGLKIRGFA